MAKWFVFIARCSMIATLKCGGISIPCTWRNKKVGFPWDFRILGETPFFGDRGSAFIRKENMSVYDIAVEANVSTQTVIDTLAKLGIKNMEEFSSVIPPFAVMAIKELKLKK